MRRRAVGARPGAAGGGAGLLAAGRRPAARGRRALQEAVSQHLRGVSKTPARRFETSARYFVVHHNSFGYFDALDLTFYLVILSQKPYFASNFA